MCQFFKFTAIFSITACGPEARRPFFREQEPLQRLPLLHAAAARPLPRCSERGAEALAQSSAMVPGVQHARLQRPGHTGGCRGILPRFNPPGRTLGSGRSISPRAEAGALGPVCSACGSQQRGDSREGRQRCYGDGVAVTGVPAGTCSGGSPSTPASSLQEALVGVWVQLHTRQFHSRLA